MKDELRELQMDESTRKNATDWLMRVISGKRPNGSGNGSGGLLEESASRSAVAVAEMPQAEAPQMEMPEFTAEDLCGAPAVPVIKVATPNVEITADDVCWVPEEMRLKPQPPVVEEPPASKVRVMPFPGSREEIDLRRPATARDPELSYLTGPSDSMITSADISRDPAPYVVEPTWNGMVAEPEAHEVTAEDLMRGPEVNYIPERSGSDLPTSFRVIRSLAPQVTESNAPAIEAPPMGIEADAPVVEAPIPAVEADAPVVEASAAVVEAAAAPVVEEVAPVIEAPVAEAPASVVEAAAEVSTEAVAEHHETEATPAHSELSAEQVEPQVQPEVVEEQAEHEVRGEVDSGENVFARQGFWGEASKAAPDEGQATPKAILRGVKRAYPGSGAEEFDQHPEGWFAAWKTMLRLGSVLPWVARALPALESVALSGEPGGADLASVAAGTGVAQETRQDMAGLRLVQYEIRTTVQDHSMQLKRMEEQLTRVRESVDSRTSENAEVAESLRKMTKLMRLAGMGVGALLLVLIALVIVMLARH